MRHLFRVLPALLVLAWTTAGCGYTSGFDGYGTSGRRVTIEVVGNETYRQRFELPITRALEEEIPVHSNWQLVGPGSASTVVQASIETVNGTTLAGGDFVSPLREGSLDFTLTARLIDRRTGQTLQEAQILDRAEFRTALGETQGTALNEAAGDIARKIIFALERPF